MAAARAHVRSRLADPDLCPAALAAHHQVSLRTLQLAFADAGSGRAAPIRTERLEHARRTLITARRARHAPDAPAGP